MHFISDKDDCTGNDSGVIAKQKATDSGQSGQLIHKPTAHCDSLADFDPSKNDGEIDCDDVRLMFGRRVQRERGKQSNRSIRSNFHVRLWYFTIQFEE
jgi:hypothetical protein